ncbi:MAG: hypothetical protein AAGA56_25110, partial [Myxococcota bacterium]
MLGVGADEAPASLCEKLRFGGRLDLALRYARKCAAEATNSHGALKFRVEAALAAYLADERAALSELLAEEPALAGILKPLLQPEAATGTRWQKDLARSAEAASLAEAGDIKAARAALQKVAPEHRSALCVPAMKAAVTIASEGAGATAALGRLRGADEPRLDERVRVSGVAELIRFAPEAAQRYLRKDRSVPERKALFRLAEASRRAAEGNRSEAALALLDLPPLDPSWARDHDRGTVLLYRAFASLAAPTEAEKLLHEAEAAGAEPSEVARGRLIVQSRRPYDPKAPRSVARPVARHLAPQPGGAVASLRAVMLLIGVASSTPDWEDLSSLREPLKAMRGADAAWLDLWSEALLARGRDGDRGRAYRIARELTERRPRYVDGWALAQEMAEDALTLRTVTREAFEATGHPLFRESPEVELAASDYEQEIAREGISPGQLALDLQAWAATLAAEQQMSRSDSLLAILRREDVIRALESSDRAAVEVALLFHARGLEALDVVAHLFDTGVAPLTLAAMCGAYLSKEEERVAVTRAEAWLAEGAARGASILEGLAGLLPDAPRLFARYGSSLPHTATRRISRAIASGTEHAEDRADALRAEAETQLEPEYDLYVDSGLDADGFEVSAEDQAYLEELAASVGDDPAAILVRLLEERPELAEMLPGITPSRVDSLLGSTLGFYPFL